ncbi:MAG TPA: hypothetical protein VIJ40_04800 [Acidimicrobiales bacterium]
MAKHPDVEVILGGENACYAHLLCDECGAVLDESHDQPCSLREESDVPES